MHELSLCRAIAATSLEHAGGRVVRRVSLRVGHFRQVVPDTLQHCWRLHTDGGPLDGCELAVAWIPAVVRCAACGANTQLERPILRCGTCRSSDVVLVSGEEFLIESIDVAQEVG